MRVTCLSEAWANAYADGDCGSSHAGISLSKEQSQQELNSIGNDKPRSLRRRKRIGKLSLFTPLLLLLIALPLTSALFDPGATEEDKTTSTRKVEAEAAVPPALVKSLSSSEGSSLSLLAPRGDPVSLHPGCRRTTDLFDNVCHNPWSPVFGGSRQSSAASRSELVICPLGEVNNDGQKEKVFAITGTITLPESMSDQLQSSASTIDSSAIHSTLSGDKEAYWPKPGDEGFWRQRDGELEWVPTEARALLESDVTPANSVKEAKEASVERVEKVASDAQAKEYDAWSASIGGEDSETWLSFEQWREKHLAAERESEKHKSAAGRKQKSDKLKEKKSHQTNPSTGSATEGADKAVSDTTAETAQADVMTATEGHSTGSAQAAKETSAHNPSPTAVEAQQAAQSATTEPPPSETSQRADEDSSNEQPVAVKADTSQDTGSIPAVGNASSRLTELKHRWNFASLDCAAVVHRSNPSAKFTSAILSEKKDRYMLSPCPEEGSEGQFVVVELCDEISVDTIVLANFEFFSRMFKRFRVRVSRNLNGGEGEWYDIGTFRARNIRGLQIFNTAPPTADSRFFRYVRIDFLEHYGSEYYCPVSLLRVYGLTQMDDYIREEEEMKKQREAELLQIESEGEGVEEGDEDPTETEAETGKTTTVPEPDRSETASSEADAVPSVSSAATTSPAPRLASADSVASPTSSLAVELSPSSSSIATKAETASVAEAAQSPSISAENSDQIASSVRDLPDTPEMSIGVPVVSSGQALYNSSHSEVREANGSDTQVIASLNPNETVRANVTANTDLPRKETNDTAAGETVGAALNDTTTAVIDEAKTKAVNASTVSSSTTANTQEASRPAGANSQQQQQQQHHGGSESIYRTITKRLNTLEMNATLSSQYMEHSRQQLREVFGRMERNQRDKIAEMLRELNSSNWRQIESLKRRQQVDLQQAIFEFDKHRQQTDAERRALLAQMHILSSEVMIEKRFGVAQLVLLLGLFVFMVLTRGSRAAPLLHQGIARISKSPYKSLAGAEGSDSRQAAPRAGQTAIEERDIIRRSAKAASQSDLRDSTRHISRAASSTPRGDRMQRSFDRPVRLRGGGGLSSKSSTSRRHHSVSHGTAAPSSPFSPIAKYTPSVTLSAAKGEQGDVTGRQRDRVLMPLQNSALLVPGSTNGRKYDQTIHIDTSSGGRHNRHPSLSLVRDAEDDDADTPVSQIPTRKKTGYEREDTPTNFREAAFRRDSSERQLVAQNGMEESGNISSSSIVGDESFGGGSDWGTERSDEEESSQSHDYRHHAGSEDGDDIARQVLPDDNDANGMHPPSISPPNLLSPLLLSSSPNTSSPLRRVQDSDAEEEDEEGRIIGHQHSHWNSVKNRRSLKRSGSGRTNGPNRDAQSNGNSSHPYRVHTPTNHHQYHHNNLQAASSIRSATPPRRHASPFNKDVADLEMS